MKNLMPWRWGKHKDELRHPGDWFEWLRENPVGDLVRKPFSQRLPAVDISEKNDKVVVRVEIPGLTEKDVELTFQDGILNIRGEKKEEHTEDEKNTFYRECRYGSFSRSVPLPKSVDWENAKARFKNGVVKVTFPKKPVEEKPIVINVE